MQKKPLGNNDLFQRRYRRDINDEYSYHPLLANNNASSRGGYTATSSSSSAWGMPTKHNNDAATVSGLSFCLWSMVYDPIGVTSPTPPPSASHNNNGQGDDIAEEAIEGFDWKRYFGRGENAKHKSNDSLIVSILHGHRHRHRHQNAFKLGEYNDAAAEESKSLDNAQNKKKAKPGWRPFMDPRTIRQKIEQVAKEQAVARGKKMFSYTYSEIHMDAIQMGLLVIIITIVGVFLGMPRLPLQTALLLVYLFAFACFLISNGLLLCPITNDNDGGDK